MSHSEFDTDRLFDPELLNEASEAMSRELGNTPEAELPELNFEKPANSFFPEKPSFVEILKKEMQEKPLKPIQEENSVSRALQRILDKPENQPGYDFEELEFEELKDPLSVKSLFQKENKAFEEEFGKVDTIEPEGKYNPLDFIASSKPQKENLKETEEFSQVVFEQAMQRPRLGRLATAALVGMGLTATIFGAITGCARGNKIETDIAPNIKKLENNKKEEPAQPIQVKNIFPQPKAPTTRAEFNTFVENFLPDHKETLNKLFDDILNAGSFSAREGIKDDIQALREESNHPGEIESFKAIHEYFHKVYHNVQNKDLSKLIKNDGIPPEKAFDYPGFSKTISELKETVSLVPKGEELPKDIRRSVRKAFRLIFNNDYDIIPVVLTNGKTINSQFELERQLSEAVASKDFKLQKEIGDALNNNLALKTLKGFVQFLTDHKIPNFKTKLTDARIEKRLDKTREAVRNIFVEGFYGTLFGKSGHKKSILAVEHPDVNTIKDDKPERDGLLQKQALFEYAHDIKGNYRAKCEILENATPKSITNTIKSLRKEYDELKKHGLEHEIDKEVIIPIWSHGYTHKDTGEHIFKLNNGKDMSLRHLKHMVSKHLLKDLPEVENVLIWSMNCRNVQDTSFNVTQAQIPVDPRIQVLFANQKEVNTLSFSLNNGHVHDSLLSYQIHALLDTSLKERQSLIPTRGDLKEQATISEILSELYFSRAYELQKGNMTFVGHPKNGADKEALIEKLDHLTSVATQEMKKF